MANYFLSHTAEELDTAIDKVLSGYKDVSKVTATETDVVIGKTIVDAEGNVKDGQLNTDDFYNDGYTEGHGNGYGEGYNDGYNEGHTDGYDKGLEDATPSLQVKTATPSTATQTIVADTNYDGLSKVIINSIPQNYTDSVYQQGYQAGLEDATPVLQEKTVTPTTSIQIVQADSEYDGLSKVNVNAIPQSYIDRAYEQGYEAGYAKAIEDSKPYLRELSYIESDGNQYINTEFVPNQDTRVVCDAQLTNLSGVLAITGERYSSATQKCFVWLSVSGNLRTYYHGTYGVVGAADTNRHVYEQNKNVSILDGNTLATRTYTTFTADFPIFIFASNEDGSPGMYSKMRCYAHQIYDNGTLVRDYIPVLDKSNTACLYCKVTKKLYYNEGTGTFAYGDAA